MFLYIKGVIQEIRKKNPFLVSAKTMILEISVLNLNLTPICNSETNHLKKNDFLEFWSRNRTKKNKTLVNKRK
jgi:hypothetical protein